MKELLDLVEEQQMSERVNELILLLSEIKEVQGEFEEEELEAIANDTHEDKAEALWGHIRDMLDYSTEYFIRSSEILGKPLLQVIANVPSDADNPKENWEPLSEDELKEAEPIGFVFGCPANGMILEELRANIEPIIKKLEAANTPGVKVPVYPSYQDLLALLIERTKVSESEDEEESDDYPLDELLDMYDELYGSGVTYEESEVKP